MSATIDGLLARANGPVADHGALLDLSILLQLTGDRDGGLALQGLLVSLDQQGLVEDTGGVATQTGGRPATDPQRMLERSDLTVKEAEKQLIIRALKDTNGNRTLAAKKKRKSLLGRFA